MYLDFLLSLEYSPCNTSCLCLTIALPTRDSKFLKDAFNNLLDKGYVFIFNSNKGLAATVCTVFLQGCIAHCC